MPNFAPRHGAPSYGKYMNQARDGRSPLKGHDSVHKEMGPYDVEFVADMGLGVVRP